MSSQGDVLSMWKLTKTQYTTFVKFMHVFLVIFCTFLSFFLLFSVINRKRWKSLFERRNKYFWPANGVRSTRSLVKIHNIYICFKIVHNILLRNVCCVKTHPWTPLAGRTQEECRTGSLKQSTETGYIDRVPYFHQ